MLKYHCNSADPEAMALLQKISGGPSPLDGRWKNPNLQRLRYLIKQDLDNIAWWYWLDDGDYDDDIPLQNEHRDVRRQQDEHRDVGGSINMNIIYLKCKLLDITKCGFDFIRMSVFNHSLIDNI
jgi:hypothetical protein